MRVRALLVVSVAALAACRPNLPPDKPLAPPIKTKGFFYTFPTGLRLVIYEDPKAKQFNLDVSYAVGARDESPTQAGLAHLAEHMAFKGRQRGPGTPQVWERLLGSGVSFNAFTTSDNTDYFEYAKPDQFNNMVALEAERMRDPLANVSDADFLSEREVVVSEYRQRLETDTDQMQLSWLMEAAFPHHPYGAEVAGSIEKLRAMKLDDVRAWYRDHYTPNNAIVVVTGPKPAAEVIHFVGAAFGKLAKGEPGKPPVAPLVRAMPPVPEDPPENAPLIRRVAPVEQPTLWLAWTTPGVASDESARARVAASTLNQFLNARFNDDKRVDDVGCFYDPNEGAGVVACALALEKADDAEKVAEVVKDQLIEFVNPDDQTQLKYFTNVIRGEMLTQLYLSIEQIDAAPIAQYLRCTGDPDYLGGSQKRVNAFLSTDVATFSYKYVNRKRTIGLLVAPAQDVVVSVKDEGAPKVGEAFDSQDASTLAFTAEQIAAIAGKPGLDQGEERKLANGLHVRVVPRGTIPLVDVRLIIDAPLAEGTTPLALRRVAASSSWRTFNGESTTHWPKVGGRPIQQYDDEQLVFGGEAPAGNLPHLLADASAWLDTPDSDGVIFDGEVRRQRADQEIADKRPRDRGTALLRNALFPGQPYGKILTAADFKDLDHSDAQSWLKSELRPERSTLLIVGSVVPSPELWEQIERNFGGWKASPAALGQVVAPLAFSPSRRILFVNRPRATQTEITLGLAMARPDPGQEASLQAASTTLERALTKELREKQGVTYGVYAFSRPLQQAQVFGLTTAVDQSATVRAVNTMLSQVQSLREKPVDEQEVQRARWQLARRLAAGFDQIESASTALEHNVELGRPVDYYETYPQSVAAVSAASIQSIAKDLHVGNEVVVVVGDATKVLPQLKAAGLTVETP